MTVWQLIEKLIDLGFIVGEPSKNDFVQATRLLDFICSGHGK